MDISFTTAPKAVTTVSSFLLRFPADVAVPQSATTTARQMTLILWSSDAVLCTGDINGSVLKLTALLYNTLPSDVQRLPVVPFKRALKRYLLREPPDD